MNLTNQSEFAKSLTNQYTQISTFIMLSKRDVKQFVKVYFVKAVEVRICQSFSLYGIVAS